MFSPASSFTHETAASELAAGLAAIDAGQVAFTFSQTSNIDSSAVACMLAWKRHARQRQADLKFQDIPANLMHMIGLYGVAEFL
jgi:phospholipid transport system transporter-binding protein